MHFWVNRIFTTQCLFRVLDRISNVLEKHSCYLTQPTTSPFRLWLIYACIVRCKWCYINIGELTYQGLRCPMQMLLSWCGPGTFIRYIIEYLFPRCNLIFMDANRLGKRGWSKFYFLTSQTKRMLWLPKRTVSLRRFFWVTITQLKTDG